jgi:hypothetical protein
VALLAAERVALCLPAGFWTVSVLEETVSATLSIAAAVVAAAGRAAADCGRARAHARFTAGGSHDPVLEEQPGTGCPLTPPRALTNLARAR